MSEDDADQGLKGRITRTGEDAIGRVASELLENPLVTGAIGRIFEAREKATQAQAVAFGALNLPSAADLERLTRRVRSVSQRLEGIEDGVDKLDRRLAGLGTPGVEQAVRDVEAGIAKRIAGASISASSTRSCRRARPARLGSAAAGPAAPRGGAAGTPPGRPRRSPNAAAR